MREAQLDLFEEPSADGSGFPVVVDEPIYRFGRMKMCHMMSCDLEALHKMADRIGVARKWFQNGLGKTPHYDICKSKRALALKFGAVETDRRGICEVIQYFRENPRQRCGP